MLSRGFLILILIHWFGTVCTWSRSTSAKEELGKQASSAGTTLPRPGEAVPTQPSTPNQVQPSSAASMRLRLKNNGFGVGKIVPSATPAVIGWQNDGFVEPFFFDVSAVRSISTLQAAEQVVAKPNNNFVIESTDGQWLIGQISGLGNELLTVQSEILGEVKLPIGKVSQLMRSDYSGEVVYPGLSQQAPWTPIGQLRDWEIRAGVLTAVKQGAAILGDLKLPSKCEILISLTWRGVPDFVVSLGVQAGERSAGQVASTARLEVWNRNIVLVRETEKDADLKRLAELNEKSPQVELSILMDQEKGLIVVQDVHGRLLGKLEVAEKTPRLGPAVHIVNHGPSLTVERLEVRQWNGSSMLGRNQNVQVVLGDNSTLNESWLSQLNPAAGQFVVEARDGSLTNVAVDNVAVASLKPPADAAAEPAANSDLAAEGAEQVEVILADRSRLKGAWLAQRDGKLVVQSNVFQRELVFPAEQVRGVIGTDQRFAPDLTAHRNGIIKIGDSELAGYLVEEVAEAGANAIRWQPHGSQSSSAVMPTAEGSIAYRLQLPISASGQPTGRLDELLGQQRGESNQPPPSQTASTTPPAEETPAKEPAKTTQVTREIVFASGDTIDGYVERADENGVYFRSDQTQVRFVEHLKLDRLWLNSLASTVKKGTDDKIRRLMTVPRAQKDDPPTHLLISVSGDFLRGRLVQLTDRSAQFDLRSTIAEIPRDRIAQIIWLHQRTWDQPATTAAVPSGYSIHVVQQERGLTFSPTHVAAGVIHGHSELLGTCQLAVKQISQILFGPNLSERVAQFRENPWVLSLAQLPRAFTESNSEAEPGIDSPLIGKLAPPFSLSQLDGQQLKLSSLEGKVVVLDFWASWCGPCMKTLPLVNQIVQTYDPDEVQMVAVNIQEAETRVQSAIDRLSITATVVLDRDGEVAASYLASAIPQTVIIDRTGLVRFVFVGGDSELAANLKDAIDELLKDAS